LSLKILGRFCLAKIEKAVEDFVVDFGRQVYDLIPHDYIAKKQSEFLTFKKEHIEQNEFIVIADFSENYSFVVQDAAQSWHWSNAQCTIHPFAIYYKSETDSLIQHQSLVVIAESLKHNFESVYQFQLILIDYLKTRFGTIKKISSFSDGAASQYKNKKNFYSMCQFKKNFGFEVEWHFFATSHGKGPCDGIGGALKRNATRASLQRPYEKQITTAKELFDWANSIGSSIAFHFCTEGEYKKIEWQLRKKFEHVKTIAGTQKFHSFCPLDENSIAARRISFAGDLNDFRSSNIQFNF